MTDHPEQNVSGQDSRKTALTCPECGYNLTGLSVDRCPECGRQGAIKDAEFLAERPRYPRLKAAVSAIAVTIAFGSGWIIELHPNIAPERAIGIGITILTCYWVWVDSIEQQRALAQIERLLLVLFSPIGLIVYLGRQRRIGQIVRLFALIALMFVAAFLGMIVGVRAETGTWPAVAW